MKHITISEQELIAIRDTISTISVRGPDDCSKIIGIINLINQRLNEGVNDGNVHA